MTTSSAAQEFQALVDVAVDAVIIIDHRGRIETFNHGAEKLFGYTAAEAIGANVSLLMPEPHRSQHDGYIERYLTSGIAHIIGIGREVDARRKDGSLFPASLAVGRIPNSDPPRFVGFLHDITLRRQALANAQSERDLAQQYLDLAQVILLALDPHNRITLINRKGCETLGQPAEALLGQDWLETFVVEEDRGDIRAQLQQLLTEPAQTTYDCECRIRGNAGAPRLIAWRGVTLRDREGNVTGTLCSGEDITDSRRAAEEELRTQQRMTHVSRLATMGEMAAGIAHELNQPLAAIANYAMASEHLLAAPTPDIAEVQGALKQVAAQALRAGEIIRRLRNLVRTREVRREAVDVNDLVKELLTLAQSDARLNDVRLSFESTEDLPRVNADGIQIQQVLLNLIRNAIEALAGHTRGEREVIVRTGRSDRGEVEVSVSDSGPGVDPAIAQRMFDPFCTTKEQGTGLGLAISKSIVEAHRGRLDHRPASPAGACFFLTLPISPGKEP